MKNRTRAAEVHFSVLLIKGICGVTASGKFTGDRRTVTCERCLVKIKNANATEADLWALEAAQGPSRGEATFHDHVKALYVLALEKREAEIERAKRRVEYEMDQLAETAHRAVEWGVDR